MKKIIELLESLEIGQTLEITEDIKKVVSEEFEKIKQEEEKREERKREKMVEDSPLREGMYEAMREEGDRIFKAKELADIVGISTQKATPILKGLVEEGLISRTQESKSKPFMYKIS